MKDEIERPKNCGECRLWWQIKDEPEYGYCDNWAGIKLTKKCVCHPNFGKKKEEGGHEK